MNGFSSTGTKLSTQSFEVFTEVIWLKGWKKHRRQRRERQRERLQSVSRPRVTLCSDDELSALISIFCSPPLPSPLPRWPCSVMMQQRIFEKRLICAKFPLPLSPVVVCPLRLSPLKHFCSIAYIRNIMSFEQIHTYVLFTVCVNLFTFTCYIFFFPFSDTLTSKSPLLQKHIHENSGWTKRKKLRL